MSEPHTAHSSGSVELKKGPLKKYTNTLKGWDTRAFHLDTTGLWYAPPGESDTSKSRFIPLLDAAITVSTTDSTRFDIKVHTHTYKLRAANAQERRQWLAHLRRVQEQVRKAHPDPAQSLLYHPPPSNASQRNTRATFSGSYLSEPLTDPTNPRVSVLPISASSSSTALHLLATSHQPHQTQPDSNTNAATPRSLQSSVYTRRIRAQEYAFQKELQELQELAWKSGSTDIYHKAQRLAQTQRDLRDALQELLLICKHADQDETANPPTHPTYPTHPTHPPPKQLQSSPNIAVERTRVWTQTIPDPPHLDIADSVQGKGTRFTGRKSYDLSQSGGELDFDMESQRNPPRSRMLSTTDTARQDSSHDAAKRENMDTTHEDCDTDDSDESKVSGKNEEAGDHQSQGGSDSLLLSDIDERSEEGLVYEAGSSALTSNSFVPRSLQGMNIWRERLPSNRPSIREFGLWNLFKDAVGKDLTRITIPMILCEPITFLQRISEDVEYSATLDKAVEIGTSDPFLQLGYIAGFAASVYCSTAGRVLKPLNPLLFETYEAIRPDRHFVLVAEQVSHHPPVGVATCISDHGWTLTYDSAMVSRFWGKSMEVRPTGLCHLRIPATGDHISWNKASANVNNVLLSSRWIDYEGDVRIQNHRTGHYCILRFVRKGWFAGPTFEIKGQVYDPAGVPHLDLFGAWNDALTAFPTHPDNKKLDTLDKLQRRDSNVPSLEPKATRLWEARKRPPHSADQYQFTSFTMQLNEMDSISKDGLCPTDARHRPDIRALEEGDMERAGDEKARLEDKQRESRKERELKGLPATDPRWFEQQFDPDTKTDMWAYKGGYFEARKARVWPSDLPNLY